MKQAFKTIMLIFGLFAVGITLAACNQNGEPDPDPDPELQPIVDVLENEESGTEVIVQGTVYLVQNNGFYISDSANGKLFVAASNLPGSVSVALGKEVQLQGTFTITNHKPTLTNVTAAELISETGTMPEAVSMTVAQIKALSREAKVGSWYQLVEIVGKVSYNEATMMTAFTDDEGNSIDFATISNSEVLLAEEGERVKLNVVLGEYASIGNVWRLVFIGGESDVVINPFTVQEVTDMLEDWLPSVVPTEISGSLTLPVTYNVIDDVTFVWATSIPDEIEILPLVDGENFYRTNVSLPDEDISGTLTVTVQYRDHNPFDLTFSITIKALTVTGLEDAINGEDDVVLVEAVVIALVKNYLDSVRSLILQDLNNPGVLITADFSRITQGDYGLYNILNAELGDVVVIGGDIRRAARQSISNIIVAASTGETRAVDHRLEDAYVMDDQASWQAFPGHNQLVKFVNPYLRYSTSSFPGQDNWIRMGYSEESVGTNFGVDNNKSISLNVRATDEVVGQSFHTDINVPIVGSPPVMFDGSFYAYILYETATYIQVMIVDPAHVIPSNRALAISAIEDVLANRLESGDLTLPETNAFIAGNITWSSSNEAVITDAGAVTYPETDTVVTMTATFIVGEEQVVADFEILVVGAVKEVLQVSDILLNAEHEDLLYTEAIVVSNLTTTNAATVVAVLVQDKTTGETMMVTGLPGGIGDGFNIGDLIEFQARFNIVGSGNMINAKSLEYLHGLDILSSNNALVDYKNSAIEVASQEDALAAFVDELIGFGQVYKFTGTFYLNASTTAWTEATNLRFHFNPDATGLTAGTRYNNGARNLSLHHGANIPFLGEGWADEFFGINADNFPYAAYPGFEYEGTFYAVLTGAANTYYYFNVLGLDDINIVTDPVEDVTSFITEAMPANIAEGDLTLPTAHELTDSGIVWSSDNEAVISDQGVVTYGFEDATVKLTATFFIDGVEHTLDFDVLVIGEAKVEMSVSEVLANAENDAVFYVQGLILSPLYRLTADVDTILLQDAVTGETMIAAGLPGELGIDFNIGDMVEFQTQFTLLSGNVNEPERKVVNFLSAFEVLSTDNSLLDYKENAIEINSYATWAGHFGDDVMEHGAVYKFSGPFYANLTAGPGNLAGTSYLRFHYNIDASAIGDIRQGSVSNGRILAIRNQAQAPVLGETWLEDYFGISDPDNTPGVGYPGWHFDGTFYAVAVSASGTFYFNFIIIDADDIDITRDYQSEVEYNLAASVPATIASGDLALPLTHVHTDAGITWTSSNPSIISDAGVITYPASTTNVTMTAAYMIDSVEYTIDFVVEVLVINDAMSVTEILTTANENDLVFAEGIVVGIWDNGSSSVTATSNGVMIKEATGNDILFVTGLYGNFGSIKMEYDLDGEGDLLAIGDHIEFFATYYFDYTVDSTSIRHSLSISTVEEAALTVVSRSNTYTFDLAAATVITDQTGLEAFAEGLPWGQLYKVEGPFALRGSGATLGDTTNLQISYNYAALTDFNMPITWRSDARPQRISFRNILQQNQLGADWLEQHMNITTENYGGSTVDGHLYDADSEIYFYLGSVLSAAVSTFGYIQVMILDDSMISTTRILPA